MGDGIDHLGLGLIQACVTQQTRHSDDAIHRRSDFMTDHRHKFAFGMIGSLSFVTGASQLFLDLDLSFDFPASNDHAACCGTERIKFADKIVLIPSRIIGDAQNANHFEPIENGQPKEVVNRRMAGEEAARTWIFTDLVGDEWRTSDQSRQQERGSIPALDEDAGTHGRDLLISLMEPGDFRGREAANVGMAIFVPQDLADESKTAFGVVKGDLEHLGKDGARIVGRNKMLLRCSKPIHQSDSLPVEQFGLLSDMDIHLRADHALRLSFVSE
jgi:hypothetical protein